VYDVHANFVANWTMLVNGGQLEHLQRLVVADLEIRDFLEVVWCVMHCQVK